MVVFRLNYKNTVYYKKQIINIEKQYSKAFKLLKHEIKMILIKIF